LQQPSHWVGQQWDNGNIQKALVVASVFATAGAFAPVAGAYFGVGLAVEGISASYAAYSTVALASAGVNSYQALSGNMIGDGTFGRVLGAAAAVSGGLYGTTYAAFGPVGQTVSVADGLVSGYEIGTGHMIGDGTLSGAFHVANLGVNRGGTLLDSSASAGHKIGIGLNLATGAASLASNGNPNLQQALRSLSIATHVWNTGCDVHFGVGQVQATVMAARASRAAVQQANGSGYGQFSVGDELEGHDALRMRMTSELAAAEESGNATRKAQLVRQLRSRMYDNDENENLKLWELRHHYDPQPLQNLDSYGETVGAPPTSSFWDFSNSIGMDFTGGWQGYLDNLNPWSENARPPVDGFGTALQYGQKGAIVVGGTAIVVPEGIYAAPYIASGTAAVESAATGATAYAQAQAASAFASTVLFAQTQGPRVIQWAQQTVNWFNTRPFVRARVLDVLKVLQKTKMRQWKALLAIP